MGLCIGKPTTTRPPLDTPGVSRAPRISRENFYSPSTCCMRSRIQPNVLDEIHLQLTRKNIHISKESFRKICESKMNLAGFLGVIDRACKTSGMAALPGTTLLQLDAGHFLGSKRQDGYLYEGIFDGVGNLSEGIITFPENSKRAREEGVFAFGALSEGVRVVRITDRKYTVEQGDFEEGCLVFGHLDTHVVGQKRFDREFVHHHNHRQ